MNITQGLSGTTPATATELNKKYITWQSLQRKILPAFRQPALYQYIMISIGHNACGHYGKTWSDC